jgi:hypothetical protein
MVQLLTPTGRAGLVQLRDAGYAIGAASPTGPQVREKLYVPAGIEAPGKLIFSIVSVRTTGGIVVIVVVVVVVVVVGATVVVVVVVGAAVGGAVAAIVVSGRVVVEVVVLVVVVVVEVVVVVVVVVVVLVVVVVVVEVAVLVLVGGAAVGGAVVAIGGRVVSTVAFCAAVFGAGVATAIEAGTTIRGRAVTGTFVGRVVVLFWRFVVVGGTERGMVRRVSAAVVTGVEGFVVDAAAPVSIAGSVTAASAVLRIVSVVVVVVSLRGGEVSGIGFARTPSEVVVDVTEEVVVDAVNVVLGVAPDPEPGEFCSTTTVGSDAVGASLALVIHQIIAATMARTTAPMTANLGRDEPPVRTGSTRDSPVDPNEAAPTSVAFGRSSFVGWVPAKRFSSASARCWFASTSVPMAIPAGPAFSGEETEFLAPEPSGFWFAAPQSASAELVDSRPSPRSSLATNRFSCGL